MVRMYTHTFKDGTTRDYTYEDILNKADEFYNLGSGSLDAVTRAGLEYIAQGGDKDAQHAQAALSHWNNPEAVKNAYYDYNKKNGIDETPPTTTPPTSVPTTSEGNTSGGATNGGDGKGGNTSGEDGKGGNTGGGDGKGDSKDWSSIIKSIYAAYGKTGESVKGKYETRLAAIDEQERYAIELAKQQRDEAVKRAYALNDQSQVTYGQNAERLAQMGLTNAGYGDYLTGVAYGNLVGGVERANVNADNAVRDAYYAAGQAKSQAYDAMHTELADAEKAYKDTLASIVTAVGSGEVDEKTAKAIAQAYGITEDEALTLIGDAANAYKDVSGETPDTTTTPSISAVTGEAFNKEDFIKAQLQGIKSSNASIGDLTDVDAELEAGNLTEDDVQPLYFENAVKWIEQGVENIKDIQAGIEELDRLEFYKKISTADKEALTAYMYSKLATELENEKYTISHGDGRNVSVKIDGEDYAVSLSNAVPEAAGEFLEKYPNKEKDTLIMYNGDLYLYDGTAWYALIDIPNSNYNYNFDQSNVPPASSDSENYYKGLKTAFNTEAKSYSKKSTKPKHQK